jgi:hypothetical protein
MKAIFAFQFLFCFCCSGSVAQVIDTLEVGHFKRARPGAYKAELPDLLTCIRSQFNLSQCKTSLPPGGSKYLMAVLKRDLRVDEIDSIKAIFTVTFSLDSPSWRCFLVQEWQFLSAQSSATALEKLVNKSGKTIYYEPPNNWIWTRRGKRLFFIYSDSFEPLSNEMIRIWQAVENFKN